MVTEEKAIKKGPQPKVPDPLVRYPDKTHRIAWYYGGQLMGYLTQEAVDTRAERYAANKANKGYYRGNTESLYSAFISS